MHEGDNARRPQDTTATTQDGEQAMNDGRVATILKQHGCLALPGVFDALSARIAERSGIPLGFVSGYSVAATALGMPDFGLLTQTEIVEQARRICAAVELPILVDADTGYGNPLNVRRTVRELIAAGAAGCFLEDQAWPKRCGHMQGKSVIGADLYAAKIQAAVDAREDRDFFIVARSDALAVEGMSSAIARVTRARELGADACFIEAPLTLEDLQTIGRESPGPNVANMIRGGRTPLLSKRELGELGFNLILHPLCGLNAAAAAMHSTFASLQRDGDAPETDFDFRQFNEIVDLQSYMELETRYQTDRENE